MREVRWSQQALRDLDKVADHYNDIAPDYADRVQDALLLAADFLLDSPGAGSPFGSRGARKWTPAGVPYVLVYRSTRNGVGIVRVHHARKDWRPR
ncbi:type II toxin-antitoxin system RelE/ParE family toxin [Sphingomonas arantia]|uniref:Type II toxin-antitoxin system RelE/ParE family toxin n=1 Tax=Sphingomonas arantia TaxID=1460676 RepID=A0ABW4U362_9SPHN